jgi:nicotinamidase-related amidase
VIYIAKYTDPDYGSIALITIDVQRDTLEGQPFEVKGTSEMLPVLQDLLRAFRLADKPIVHIVRLYQPDGGNAELCRKSLIENGTELFQPGSTGCELAPELLPEPDLTLDTDLLLSNGIQKFSDNEVVIYKPRWGAFYKTPLEDHLKELGITTLAFTGCNFPNCPRASLYEASERDYKIIIVEDTMSFLDKRDKIEMESIGVVFSSAKELENAIINK